jgi:hypothetical protein
VLISDECWVALANLHREHPERASFSPREIIHRTAADAPGQIRAGVQPHVYLHNVANVKPSSGRYRMFYRLDSGQLRLFRPGDMSHPERRGKTHPRSEDLPPGYQPLLDWYEHEYCRNTLTEQEDPVLAMTGVGKELWRSVGGGDKHLREERDPGNWSLAGDFSMADELWSRLVKHVGQTFHTTTGKPFCYTVEGNGVHFEREGRRMNKRMSRADFDKAVSRLPLSKTTDIKDCFDYAYLFALLTDERIFRRSDLAA